MDKLTIFLVLLPSFKRIYLAMAIDKGHYVILVLLDLSAAFDIVDHCKLLSRLNTRFGICGKALDWFRSYLSGRTQFVKVNSGIFSHSISQGVPQRSVLGPILYSPYTSPLGDIARAHELNIHFYADDTQLYITYPYLVRMIWIQLGLRLKPAFVMLNSGC